MKSLSLIGRALRETGHRLNTISKSLKNNNESIINTSLTSTNSSSLKSTHLHRSIMSIKDKVPTIGNGVFIAPNATIIGDVDIADNASVWYGTVIKGDMSSIKIGGLVNIQDNCSIHTIPTLSNTLSLVSDVTIGNHVTIGHGVTIKPSYISNNVLIGMNSTISEGVYIEDNVIIGSGSVIAPGQLLKSNHLYVGNNPCLPIRELTPDEIDDIKRQAELYHSLANTHEQEYTPYITTHP